MFSLFKKRNNSIYQVAVNGEEVTSDGRTTVLQTALENDILFPYNCRVGSCGTCKCRLIKGKIKALTDHSYTLNENELASGFILACQSVPIADIEVEFDTEKAARVMSRLQARTE